MTFTIHDCEQRSAEWYRARLGRVTGSNAADLLASGKGSQEAATRRNYRAQLVVERITGMSCGSDYINDAMRWGIEHEDEAVRAYEAATGQLVRRTGFLSGDDLMVGCSLDGDVDEFTSIIEVKCPTSQVHFEYLKTNGAPSKYLPQITHNLWISGAKWCDFVSYDPRFPEGLRLHIVRVEAQDFTPYELAVRAFLFEVGADEKALREKAYCHADGRFDANDRCDE